MLITVVLLLAMLGAIVLATGSVEEERTLPFTPTAGTNRYAFTLALLASSGQTELASAVDVVDIAVFSTLVIGAGAFI